MTVAAAGKGSRKKVFGTTGHWRRGSCAKLMPCYFSNTVIALGTYRPQWGMCAVLAGCRDGEGIGTGERGSWHGLQALATRWPVTAHPKGSKRKAVVPDAATWRASDFCHCARCPGMQLQSGTGHWQWEKLALRPCNILLRATGLLSWNIFGRDSGLLRPTVVSGSPTFPDH